MSFAVSGLASAVAELGAGRALPWVGAQWRPPSLSLPDRASTEDAAAGAVPLTRAGEVAAGELREAGVDRVADAGQVEAGHAEDFLAAAMFQIDVWKA